MSILERKSIGALTNYVLDGRALTNGDALELRLRGNRDWLTVEVDGLPGAPNVRWTSDAGAPLHASIPDDAELRWP